MRRGERIAWAGLLLLAAAVRLPFLVNHAGRLDADEAMAGFMAQRILAGDFPVFFFGQAYMGSFETYLSAAVFFAAGSSPQILLVVPLALSLLFAAGIGLVARRWFGRIGGLAALGWGAMCPPYLLDYGLSPRLGYIETLVFGTFLILVIQRVFTRPKGSAGEMRLFLVLGFITGLAVWTNLLILPILAACGAVVVLRDAGIPFRRAGGFFLLGVIMGGAPFWLWNAGNGFATFVLTRGGDVGRIDISFGRFIREAAPYILGLKDMVTLKTVSILTPVLGAAYAALVVLFAARAVGVREEGAKRWRERPEAWILLLISFAAASFVLSRFGLMGSPRYLLPLYIPIPLLIASAIAGSRSTVVRRIGISAGIIILAGNLVMAAGTYKAFTRPGAWDAKAPPTRPLVEELQSRGIEHVYANYDHSVRLTFESQGQVLAAEPIHERYKSLERAVRASDHAAYVFFGLSDHFGDPESFAWNLAAQGWTATQERAGGADVFHSFRNEQPSLAPIPADGWRAASDPEGEVWKAFDRRPETRWASGRPKRDGMWFAVDLGKVLPVAAITLLPGLNALDAPIGLRVEVSHDGMSWREVGRLDRVIPGMGSLRGRPHLNGSGRAHLRWPPVMSRFIRVSHRGAHRILDWSIGELFVYSERTADEEGNGVLDPCIDGSIALARKDHDGESLFRRVLAEDPECESAHIGVVLAQREGRI